MASIPLPFVVSLLLALLLAGIVRADDEAPPNPPFLALLAACMVQSALIGLRWGYGVDTVRLVLPVVAATIPPLVYASFASLARTEREGVRWLHIVLPSVVLLLILFWRAPIDIVLIAISLAYAFALLRLAMQGPDALVMARFDGVGSAHSALVAAAAVLILSAIVDAFVLIDLQWSGGRYMAAVIGIANLVNLLLLGLAARVAARTRAKAEPEEPAPPPVRHDDKEATAILERVDEILLEQGLFRDPNLNLTRLARRAGLTPRRISAAINRVHGRNVSQHINSFRIDEARRLLETTGDPVTKVMFDSGFQTKSNFNREFRRLTGVSPVNWRATSRAKPRAK